MTQTPLLEFRNVRKSYQSGGDPVDVLRDVSFVLAPGETLAMTGESGSGKSTLLHLAGCLDVADQGEILLSGQAYGPLDDTARARLRRTRIGLIFQQFNLIPSLSVRQNLAFQARLAENEDNEWTAKLAERLGLAAHLDRFPENLSGGQQQRVAIGRALALRPEVILADEPTGNLDEENAAIVLDLLLELVRDTGSGLLFVTHSTALASRLDRRLHLRRGSLLAEAA